jgi:hypothetical protein
MKLINFNNELYQLKRSFKIDSWFGKAVENFPINEILEGYHVDKLLKDTNGNYLLVNKVDEAEIVEDITENSNIIQ